MRLSRATRLVALCGVLSASACTGTDDTNEPVVGAIEVTVRTEGSAPDPDGYSLSVDGGAGRPVGVNDELTLDALAPGSRRVRLEGLEANCYVSGDAERSVSLQAGETATLEFVVVCPGQAAGIRVVSVTTGADLDADGFDVRIGGPGGRTRRVPANGTTLVTGVPAGEQSIAVTGIASNCTANATNPATVNSVPNQVAAITLSFTCVAVTGTARIVTTTSGASLDPDGYAVVSAGGTTPIGINGTLLVAGLLNGVNSISLSGVAANCTVDGGTDRSVTITIGGTTDVLFAVTCMQLPNLTVTTTTSGIELDPDGYTVRLASNDYYSSFFETKAVASTGSVTFTGLPAGTYTLSLEGVAPNCNISVGIWYRNITIGASNDAEAFAVTCNPSRKLAVTVGKGPAAEIYLVSETGTTSTRLTTNSALDDDAAWSADGSRIAFVSERDGNREIYVMNADGSGQSRLTTSSGTDTRPAWSPDGSRIAFVSSRDGNPEIYVMNADGTNLTRLTSDPGVDGDPGWSPDGRKIVFSRTPLGGTPGVFVMNADGTGAYLLFGNGTSPAWSPDGYSILFVQNVDDQYYGYGLYSILMSIVPNGRNPTTVQYFPFSTVGDLSLSPDGERIAISNFAPASCGSCSDQVVLLASTGAMLGNLGIVALNPAWRP
jgi:Tol biopolymer transport system component